MVKLNCIKTHDAAALVIHVEKHYRVQLGSQGGMGGGGGWGDPQRQEGAKGNHTVAIAAV